MKSILLTAFFLGSTMFAADKPEAPEAIFYNGSVYWSNGFEAQYNRVHTGTNFSFVGDRPQAFTVTNGRITRVGMTSDIRKLAGPKTQLVDLQGAFVMPGFN